MRFVFEMQGVIDADTEEAAREMAERIARETRKGYQFPTLVSPSAVIATCEIESLAPKVRVEAVA